MTTTERLFRRALKRAQSIGTQHGTDAAGWVTQELPGGGRNSRGTKADAARILQGIEDGDPLYMDKFDPPQWLSGEWAGDPTAADILAECGVEDPESDAADDILREYESAASQAYWVAIGSHLRAFTKP